MHKKHIPFICAICPNLWLFFVYIFFFILSLAILLAIQMANLQIQKRKSGPNIQRTVKNTWSLVLIQLTKDVDHDCDNVRSGKNTYPLLSPVVSTHHTYTKYVYSYISQNDLSFLFCFFFFTNDAIPSKINVLLFLFFFCE